MSTLINKEVIAENYAEAMAHILDPKIFTTLPIVTEDMIDEVADAMHDTHDSIMETTIQELIDSLPKLCPICGLNTVEWEYTDTEEHVDEENQYAGTWVCDYNEGGCGSSSGWKPNNSITSWLRYEEKDLK
jgi:hypothetical protein